MDWQIIVYIMLDGLEWTEYQEGISSGTMNLEKSIVQGDIAFGAIYASMFSCQLYMMEDDLVGKKIKVVRRQDGTDTTIFTGMIDSSTTDYSGTYRDIVAYDSFYFEREKNLATWWNNFWENRESATIKQIREGCCTAAGLSYVSRTLTNDSVSVTKSEAGTFTKVSFEEVLHAVSEITATFPIINGDGAVDWIFFSSTSSTVSADEIETASSEYQDFVTDKIDSVTLQDTETNIMQYVGVENGNPYAIVGNFLVTSLSAAKVTTVMTAILNKIKDISFNPCTVKLIYPLWNLHLGDRITTPHGVSYVMGYSFSGIQLLEESFGAYASAQRNEKTSRNYNSNLISGRKFSAIKNDIDSISLKVGKVVDDETGEINAAEIILAMNNDESTARIAADKVVLDGLVTFQNLQNSGETVINGSNITTGVITDGGNDPNFTLDLTNGTLNIKQLTTIAEKVDNFKIGTKNILQGTAKMEGSSSWARDKFYKRGTGTVTFEYDLADSPVTGVNKGVLLTPTQADTTVGIAQLGSEIRGETMTLSVFVKGTAGDKIVLRCFWGTSSADSSGDKTLTIDQTGVWERKVFTSNIAPPNPGYAYYIGYVYFKSSTVGHSCVICAPMLEYGTIPSDWGAAEEDVYKDYRSEISQTADSITATVSANQVIFNLLPTVYHTESLRSNPHVNAGITWTLNNDGSVTAKGTAPEGTNSIYHFVAGAFADNDQNKYDVQPLTIDPTKKYTLSGCQPTGSSSTYRMMARLYTEATTPNWYNNGDYIIDTGTGATTGESSTSQATGYKYAYVYAIVYGGYTTPEDGITFHPMFEVGDTKHAYQSTHSGTNAMRSQIKQTADSITSTVEATYETKANSTINNLLPSIYGQESSENPHTHNGVTYTVNKDGTITATGKATGGNSFFYVTWTTVTSNTPPIFLDPTKKYTLSGGADGGAETKYFLGARLFTGGQNPAGTGGTVAMDTGSGVTIDTGYRYAVIYIRVYDGTNLGTEGIKFEPMLEVGDTKHAYQSSHNGTGGLLNSALSSARSEISQTAEAITSTVAATYQSKADTGGVNLLPSFYYTESVHSNPHTNAGITWTLNDDGSVTAKGTATANSIYHFVAGKISSDYDIPPIRLDTGKKYTLYGCPPNGAEGKFRLMARLYTESDTPDWASAGSDGTPYADAGNGVTTGTGFRYAYVYAIIYSGYNTNNYSSKGVTFYPMFEVGSTQHGYQSTHLGASAVSKRLVSAESTIEQTADKIGLVVTGTTSPYSVNAAKIVAAINNDGTSSTVIEADHISLTGKTINLTSDNVAITTTSGNFGVTTSGYLTAASGNIAGWTINSTTIKNEVSVDSVKHEAGIYAPTNPQSDGSNAAFYVLNKGDNTYPFLVRYNGQLIARKATITGDITANSLTLGSGVTIPYSKVSNTPDLAVYITKTGEITRGTVADGSNGINISSNGLLQASNAVIYGTLYSSAGKIANWTIDTNSITRDATIDNKVYQIGLWSPVSTAPTGSTTAFYVWNKTDNTYPFRVNYNGNAEITGKITASSGAIGGWTISDTTIYRRPTIGGVTYEAGLWARGDSTITASDQAFYVYNRSTGSYPFYVTYEGKLKATNVEITGGTVSGSLITSGISATNITTGTLNADRIGATTISTNKLLVNGQDWLAWLNTNALANADGSQSGRVIRVGNWNVWGNSGTSVQFSDVSSGTTSIRIYPRPRNWTTYADSTVTAPVWIVFNVGTAIYGLSASKVNTAAGSSVIMKRLNSDAGTWA